MDTDRHTYFSSYREKLLEHLFVGEVMRHCWTHGRPNLEVLKSEVDSGGYDVVLESGDIVRHVQLKASHEGSHTPEVPINIRLASKPSGCIVWMYFDPDTLAFNQLLWFGSEPRMKIHSLDQFPVARHTKANASGIKTLRPDIRRIPRRAFTQLDSIDEVVEKLFGPWPLPI